MISEYNQSIIIDGAWELVCARPELNSMPGAYIALAVVAVA